MKAECREGLLQAINQETLGQGSVAEGEYLRNMRAARQGADGVVRWVEVCYCPTPLQEERPYWEEYFEITRIQDAHDRRRCRDLNGSEPWACEGCDCTARLENRLNNNGASFLERLRLRDDPQEYQTQRDAQHRRQHQPGSTAGVDLAPVLHDHD